MSTVKEVQAIVAVGAEVAEAAKELENIRGFVTQMNARAEELRKVILNNMEVGQDGYFEGHKVVAVNSRASARLDRKNLEKSHPELVALFEEFTVRSVTPVIETF
jgi:hypothetical protein